MDDFLMQCFTSYNSVPVLKKCVVLIKCCTS